MGESGKDVFSEIAKEANLNLEKMRFDRNQKESNYDVIIVIGYPLPCFLLWCNGWQFL